MLVIFKKKPIKKLKVYMEYHQLQILSIELINHSSILIKTKDQSIIIESSDALRLSKYFVRNYFFSTQASLKRYSLQTISDNRNDFPQYTPDISPSQMIQFSFNSFCSLFNEQYKHRIIRFIHYFISTGNPIFDFSCMPLPILDESFLSHSMFHSLFLALLDLSFLNGIQCTNSNIPHFLSTCAEFFQINSFVSILSLPNCNLKTGGKDLAESIRMNQEIELQYLDLSQNNIEDIKALTESLQYLNSPLFYLNLNDNFLDLEATSNLFNNINKNQNLHSLTHILVNKSTINDQILTDFSHHISSLAHQKKNVLTYLDLGAINKGSDLLFQSLANNQVPLECLKIAGSKLNNDSINHFNIFLSNAPSLQELDISNTNLDMKDIGSVINSIQSNKKITEFTLHVNLMKLHGKRLLDFMKRFADHSLSKWVGLGLEGNGIDTNDLRDLITLFQSMINLSWINLSCNFTSSMKKLDTELSKLLSIPRLNFIGLRGNIKKTFKGKSMNDSEIKGKKAIANRALLSFISSMNNLTHPIGLDLRFNNLQDEAIVKLGELAANDKISELLLDCDRIKKIESLIGLCNSISQSNSIISFNFPLSDYHAYIKPYKSRTTPKDRHTFRSEAHKIDNARIKALLNVMKNQTSSGYHSSLTFQHVSELDKIIDESIINMNDFLKNRRPFKHSIFSETIGLPLPFQRDKEKASSATKVQNYKRIFSSGPGSYYFVPELLIQEKNTNDSMQFNSLCLRRPGASTSFQIPDPINAMITDSFISLSSLYSSRNINSINSSRNTNTLDKSANNNLNNNFVKNLQSHTLVNDDNPYNSIRKNRQFNNINQPNSISKPTIDKCSNQGIVNDGLKIYEDRDVMLTSESNTGSLVRLRKNSFISSSSTKDKKKKSSKNQSSESEKKIKAHKNQSSEGEKRIKSRKSQSSESEKRIKTHKNQSSGSEKRSKSRNHSSDSDEYEYYEYLIEVDEEEDDEYIEEIEYLYENEEEEENTVKRFITKDKRNDGRKDAAEKTEIIKKAKISNSESSPIEDKYINLNNSSDSSDIEGKRTQLNGNDSEGEFINLKRKSNNRMKNSSSSDSFTDTNRKKAAKRNKNFEITDTNDDDFDYTRRKNVAKKTNKNGRKSDTDNSFNNKKLKNEGKRNKNYESSDSDDFVDTKRRNNTKKNNNFESNYSNDDFDDTRRKNNTKSPNKNGRKSDTDNSFNNKKLKNEGKRNKNYESSDSDDFVDTKRRNNTKRNQNFESNYSNDDIDDTRRKNIAKKINKNGRKSDTGSSFNNKKVKNEGKRNKNYESSDSDDFVDTKRRNNTKRNQNFERSGRKSEAYSSNKKGKMIGRKDNSSSSESSDSTDDYIDLRRKNTYKRK